MMRETTLRLVVREFEQSDYERLVEIYNAKFPDFPSSVTEMRFDDESLDKSKYHHKRYACLDEDSGTILGFSKISNSWWNFHPKKFTVSLWVDPKHQSRGVGSRMYDMLAVELERLDAETAWVYVKEDLPRSVAFASRRGFVEKQRMWESRLNPADVDRTMFQKYADKVSVGGVRISTLAEEQLTDKDCLGKLYELTQDLWMDVPLPVPYTRVSYEQWEARDLKNPGHLPDGFFIAVDGSRFVGLSNVWRIEKEPRSLFQVMTGVRREYRGRGVAMALKLRVTDYALRNGFDKITTMNDSYNAPMLAVNTRLGFKRQVGWITMEKQLKQPMEA